MAVGFADTHPRPVAKGLILLEIALIAEVEAAFRKGTDEVLAALDSLTPEETELTLDSGQGWTMPMSFLMKLPGWHATLHTGQIDFIQTCWDDQEIYVG